MRARIVLLSAFLTPHRSGAEACVEEVSGILQHRYDIIIVTGRHKRAIEDHFDRSLELEWFLSGSGNNDMLQVVRELANILKQLTSKWIGATRDGLTLNQPLGSAIQNGTLYAVDINTVRMFYLASGAPKGFVEVPEATGLNGVGVAPDGTVYASNTGGTQRIYKLTASGETSVFAEGAPLNAPNGVAIDNDGNIVVVNVGDNAVITFNPAGEVVKTEHAFEGGNDGVVTELDGM
mgnify:CR=1 FL=1